MDGWMSCGGRQAVMELNVLGFWRWANISYWEVADLERRGTLPAKLVLPDRGEPEPFIILEDLALIIMPNVYATLPWHVGSFLLGSFPSVTQKNTMFPKC
mmetsp:Transcript_51894/g.155755  ORF Transcript_51894/g.155755 Transcript_51894/m.155755 type:complete len:100 (+) Transcript_51894:691-990(+)